MSTKHIKILKKTFEIGTCAITGKLSVYPSDMLNLMQQMAVLHSDELGYSFNHLKTMKKGWALKNWQAEFYRLPVWREKITVETWTTSYSRLLCGRSFLIADNNGEKIAAANSKWILMDMARRRPVKPDKEMLDVYISDKEDALPDADIPVQTTDECEKVSESSFYVRRSHTDANMHVNNIKYVCWAEDDLPDSVFYGNEINKIFVDYRKECRCGELVLTTCYKTNANEYTDIIKNSGGDVLAEVIISVNEE